MYTGLLHFHSYWAYLVLLMLFIAVFNNLIGLAGKRTFETKDTRIGLFTLIAAHIQLLIGIILFFVSPMIQWFSGNAAVGDIMKNDQLRLYNVEHPLMMLIAIALITIGYSKHKKKETSKAKFKTLFIFYLLALVFILAMIPWNAWM